MTIYTLPSQGLSSLAKELMAAACVMQTSFNELSTPVSGNAKCKQTKAEYIKRYNSRFNVGHSGTEW